MRDYELLAHLLSVMGNDHSLSYTVQQVARKSSNALREAGETLDALQPAGTPPMQLVTDDTPVDDAAHVDVFSHDVEVALGRWYPDDPKWKDSLGDSYWAFFALMTKVLEGFVKDKGL